MAVWGLFFPQPVAAISAAFIILSQSYLIVTGNYSWLNFLTIILAFSGFSDGLLQSVLGIVPPAVSALPLSYLILIILLTLVIIYLSIVPVKNILSSHQKMNLSFNNVHLVNTYGAFGRVTKKRYEIIIEGTADKELNSSAEWITDEFKGKPGALHQRPSQISPYHLRLDWQMWFAAMSPSPRRHPWFRPFIARLLQNDTATLALLKKNPFADKPPVYIRARLFHYEYTTPEERKKTGNWWRREFVSEYLPPVSMNARP